VGEIVNVSTVGATGDGDEPPGYRVRSARLGPALGAQQMGATVYELDPGESVCPYHYEGIEEEWLLVLSGASTLRTPGGEQDLVAGDLVAFPPTPDGAHKVTNGGGEAARVLMIATRPPGEMGICVYPDSDKVSVWPPGKTLPMSSTLGYWDGEA
jgi:uncharacterized cupin superfamily protein